MNIEHVVNMFSCGVIRVVSVLIMDVGNAVIVCTELWSSLCVINPKIARMILGFFC